MPFLPPQNSLSRDPPHVSSPSPLAPGPDVLPLAAVGFNTWYLSRALRKPAPTPNPFEAIRELSVLRVTDGSPATVPSLWKEDEKAVLMLFRSFG